MDRARAARSLLSYILRARIIQTATVRIVVGRWSCTTTGRSHSFFLSLFFDAPSAQYAFRGRRRPISQDSSTHTHTHTHAMVHAYTRK